MWKDDNDNVKPLSASTDWFIKFTKGNNFYNIKGTEAAASATYKGRSHFTWFLFVRFCLMLLENLHLFRCTQKFSVYRDLA